MRFLRSFRERGTLLFVSHDTSSVLALCDRAIWLDRGKVRSIDVAKKVVTQYLEGLYVADAVSIDDAQSNQTLERVPVVVEYKDQRADFINNSTLRNDIEMFEFDENAGHYSDGPADILDVAFHEDNKQLTWVVGGECVTLRIQCVTEIDLDRPIVGFLIKNRLGQSVFGDNTYIAYHDSKVTVPAGKRCVASFEFTMPLLPAGEYTMDVSIANGEQRGHRMLNWKYDVLAFSVQSSCVVHGLIAVPMKSIVLEVDEA